MLFINKIGWWIALLLRTCLAFTKSHLWDWVLSGNVAQGPGARCWLFVYLGNFPVLIIFVSYHHTWCSLEYPLLHLRSSVPSVYLTYARNCMHYLSAIIPSTSRSFSLYSTFYSSPTELLSIPRKLHGLSPFLASCYYSPCFSHFFAIATDCSPDFVNSIYILGVNLDVTLFRKHSSPFLSTVSPDEMFFLCATSSTCYFFQT